jgi:hypothetical protein
MNNNELDELNSEDLASFPDLQSYEIDLEKLESYDFSNLSNAEILDIIYDLARTVPGNVGWFEPQNFNYHKFYRVRKNIDRNIEDITLAQTYSYPPGKFCFENGRANLKGKSVFYCSNEPLAALMEIKPEAGDEIFLSVWEGIADKRIKVGSLLPPDLTEENVWNEMAKNSFQNTLKKLHLRAGDKTTHLEMLCKFFSYLFRTESKPYPLTSMISWEYLYGQMWRDLIIYPSVVSNELYCNMAFHPNSVDRNLRFEKVIKLKVDYVGEDSLKYSLGKKVGFIENTKMKWRDRTDMESELLMQNKPAANNG